MFGDVAQPHRLGLVDEQAQDAAPGGQVADALMLGDADPLGDELDEQAVRPDDAQRAVPGIGQPARGQHDAVQRAAQVQIAADPDDGVQQG